MAQPRGGSRSRTRRSSVWRLDNAGSDDALAVQLLDPAPREISKKGIFVAYERFELGHIIGAFDRAPGLVFFSDILRRDMNVRATTQSIQNVLEEAAIQHGKENSFSAK
jgi:hypothetical protein